MERTYILAAVAAGGGGLFDWPSNLANCSSISLSWISSAMAKVGAGDSLGSSRAIS